MPTEATLCYVKAMILTMAAAAAVVAAGSEPGLAHPGRDMSGPFSCHMRAQQQLPCPLLMHSLFFLSFWRINNRLDILLDQCSFQTLCAIARAPKSKITLTSKSVDTFRPTSDLT